MVIALAEALHRAGVNYQRALHVTATDIDLRCVHMTYVQAVLLHIPAEVQHGDSIRGEVWSRWVTPAHVLGGWAGAHRQRARRRPQWAPSPPQRAGGPRRWVRLRWPDSLAPPWAPLPKPGMCPLPCGCRWPEA